MLQAGQLPRRTELQASEWWDDTPRQQLGPHDGLPDTLRQSK